jgi:hypothetical protein
MVDMSDSEPTMTVADVSWVVERIADAAAARDNEAAHCIEDTLYVDVLRAIASGHPDPVALAATALTTQEIRVSRWCA